MDEEEFEEWIQEWKTISEDKKLGHTQKLFQMLLSADSTVTYYYSFCNNDIYDEDCQWHCIKCQRCMEWRVWHCNKCDKCK
jgi:hypothetical protein